MRTPDNLHFYLFFNVFFYVKKIKIIFFSSILFLLKKKVHYTCLHASYLLLFLFLFFLKLQGRTGSAPPLLFLVCTDPAFCIRSFSFENGLVCATNFWFLNQKNNKENNMKNSKHYMDLSFDSNFVLFIHSKFLYIFNLRVMKVTQ